MTAAPIPLDEQAERLTAYLRDLPFSNDRVRLLDLETADGRLFELTVQPKGLAELQAGILQKVREIIDAPYDTVGNTMVFLMSERLSNIRDAFKAYDAALASLGKQEAAGGGA